MLKFQNTCNLTNVQVLLLSFTFVDKVHHNTFLQTFLQAYYRFTATRVA